MLRAANRCTAMGARWGYNRVSDCPLPGFFRTGASDYEATGALDYEAFETICSAIRVFRPTANSGRVKA
jgi:hypothetical protein